MERRKIRKAMMDRRRGVVSMWPNLEEWFVVNGPSLRISDLVGAEPEENDEQERRPEGNAYQTITFTSGDSAGTSSTGHRWYTTGTTGTGG